MSHVFPSQRRLLLHQQLIHSHNVNQVAHARYARSLLSNSGGDNSDDDVLDRSISSRNRINGVLNNRDRRQRQHARERAEVSHTADFLLLTMFYLRVHLKLIMSVAVIFYFSYVLDAQSSSEGWIATRKVGYKQEGQCIDNTSHFGIKEVFTPSSLTSARILSLPIVFETDIHSEDAIKLCFSAEKDSYDWFEAMNDDYSSMDQFSTDEQLNARAANNPHNYFPSSVGIMLFAHFTALLTILMENRYSNGLGGNDNGSNFASDREFTLAQRVNHTATILLFLLLSLSSQNQSMLKSEDCHAAFGLNSTKNINGVVADEINLCTKLDEWNVRLASVINPNEPYIVAYGKTTMFLALFLLLGMVIKPEFGTPAPRTNQHAVMPHGMFELLSSSNRGSGAIARYQRHTERNLGSRSPTGSPTGSGPASQDGESSDAFLERYATIAKRNAMIAKWTVLDKPDGVGDGVTDGDSSASMSNNVEERNRCCTICLDPLFPYAVDAEKQKNLEPDSDHVDLEAQVNIPSKDKPTVIGVHRQNSNGQDKTVATVVKKDVDDTCFELPCGHKYHKACILEWALSNPTCPECRANLDGTKDPPADADMEVDVEAGEGIRGLVSDSDSDGSADGETEGDSA